jgi:hypothetical protein
MSDGGMLYLIMVVAAFLCFASALMWAMLNSSRTENAARAHPEPPREAAHGRWSHGGAD